MGGAVENTQNLGRELQGNKSLWKSSIFIEDTGSKNYLTLSQHFKKLTNSI